MLLWEIRHHKCQNIGSDWYLMNGRLLLMDDKSKHFFYGGILKSNLALDSKTFRIRRHQILQPMYVNMDVICKSLS